MQLVHFHASHREAVLAGTKASTVRWRESIAPGPAHFVFGDAPAPTWSGRVLDVVSHSLADLTAEAAHQPPGTDMRRFAQDLRSNHYPDMGDEAHVEVVTFVLEAPLP